MTYVITLPCVGNKDGSCVNVCPVDCIQPAPGTPEFETAEQLFIDPDQCIGCDSCRDACPVDAIFPEDEVPAEHASYVEKNAAWFAGV